MVASAGARPAWLSTSLLLLVAVSPQQVSGRVVSQIPEPTVTVPFHEIDVLAWPLMPTPAPGFGSELLPRQLNTVCGYVGGDPDLPATCSAGSYCAIDVEHGAIGCCPDGAPCTKGVYTGCVDSNSGPQTEVNPYVYTCGGSNVCYKNEFQGGFSQYGCGSASNLAATVATSVSGKSALPLSSFSATLTAQPTTLTEPTTIGSKSETSKSHSSHSSHSTKTTQTSSRTTSSAPSSTSTASEATDAPKSDGEPEHLGAIIGGSIAGAAVLAMLLISACFLWKRRRSNARQGPGVKQETQYVSPMVNRNHFVPLTSIQEETEGSPMPQHLPRVHGASPDLSDDSREDGPEILRPSYSRGQRPASSGAGVMAIGNTRPSAEDDDEVPLTGGYHNRYVQTPQQRTVSPRPIVTPPEEEFDLGPYPGRRSNRGGGTLWHQNRKASNLMWM